MTSVKSCGGALTVGRRATVSSPTEILHGFSVTSGSLRCWRWLAEKRLMNVGHERLHGTSRDTGVSRLKKSLTRYCEQICHDLSGARRLSLRCFVDACSDG